MGRKKKKMKEAIIITDGEDRISNLSESLIHHILSFLLMRDVVRTSLLSKRWRNIWKSAPVLRFQRRRREFPGDNDMIDQFLVHYVGQKVKVLQVELDCQINDSRLESWVRFAAMHGVEELDISVEPYDGTLPSCLFICLEMRVLKLSLDECSPPAQPFCFPLLTKLHFTDFKWKYLDTSACPLLQVLIIEGIYDSLEIHAPNPKLRYLDISESCFGHDDNPRLTLYAPNVLHFKFKGAFGMFYDFKDISSVKTLSLYSSREPNENRMAESAVQLLGNLTHVESLKLCQACIMVLGYGETIGLEIPSLSATCLEFKTNLSKFVLVGITSLLRASRCVERLIINLEDPYIYYDIVLVDDGIEAVKAWESLEDALSVELALNTILIQHYPGCQHKLSGSELDMKKFDFEVKLVEVLLKSSKMLKKMSISIMNPPFQPLKLQLLYGLTKKLLVFPRASANAEVHFA